MKTASEWTDESIEKGGDDADGFVAFIEAVQRDAIEAAAKVADRKRWGEGRSPIADAIRAIAPGGKPPKGRAT